METSVLSPILDEVNFNNLVNARDEAIDKLIKDLAAKKESLIKDRIKELTGEDVDLIMEIKRMFPRIKGIRASDKSESFYWNDGSVYGKHLITFYPYDEMFEASDGLTVKMTCGIKYK